MIFPDVMEAEWILPSRVPCGSDPQSGCQPGLLSMLFHLLCAYMIAVLHTWWSSQSGPILRQNFPHGISTTQMPPYKERGRLGLKSSDLSCICALVLIYLKPEQNMQFQVIYWEE